MADTTSLNNGEKSEISNRLVDYFLNFVGHNIHTLGCILHVNEIYFNHVLSALEGKTKSPKEIEERVHFLTILSRFKYHASRI